MNEQLDLVEKLEADRQHEEFLKRRAIEVAAECAKREALYRKIALDMPGHDVRIADGKFVVDGVDLRYSISIEDQRERTHSRFRLGAKTGERIVVGQYGDRTSYPQRKDGGHNYEKIAQNLLGIVAAEKRKAAARANEQANTSAAQYVKEITDSRDSYRIYASDNPEKPVRVTVDVKVNLTHEQAIDLVRALKAAGVYV
jgi:hypothetical protein